MSLSDRIKQTTPIARPRGCSTCTWFDSLTKADQASILDWINNDWSMRQLYKLCREDPDNPVPISLSAFKNHIHDCLGIP